MLKWGEEEKRRCGNEVMRRWSDEEKMRRNKWL